MRQKGVSQGGLRVYCSQETHTWIQKAADISGLGTAAIRWVPTDDEQRMSLPALREQIMIDIESGDKPFVVVGTAGSVSTGAIDPLPEMAAICREFDLGSTLTAPMGALRRCYLTLQHGVGRLG